MSNPSLIYSVRQTMAQTISSYYLSGVEFKFEKQFTIRKKINLAGAEPILPW